MFNRDLTKMEPNQALKKRENEDVDNSRPKKQTIEIIEHNSCLKTVILQGFPSFLIDWAVKTPEKPDSSIPWEISAVNQLLSECPSAKCINVHIKSCGTSRSFAHVTFSSDNDLRKLLTAAQNHQLKVGGEILTATLFPDDWTLIEQLDDNSLLKIFSMLGPEDKLNVEKVCKRWESLALRSWCNQKKLKIWENSSRERVKEYFTRGGRYIEDLCVAMLPGDGRLTMENCRNIVKFAFAAHSMLSGDIETNEVCVMLKNLEKLKSLEITHVDAELQYDIMSILPESMEEIRIAKGYHNTVRFSYEQDVSKFDKLHTLQITRFFIGFNGIKGLEKLKNLKHLDFKCSYPPASILSSIRGFSKLEYLSIATGDIRDDVLIDIINKNQALEYLDISYSQTPLKDTSFRIISKLPNLKTLSMKDSPNATLKLMGTMPQLEQLKCRNCPRVRNEPLLKILRTSPRLSYLNVVNCDVDQAFFKEAAAIVEERKLSIVTSEDVLSMDELTLDIMENSGDTSEDSDYNDSRDDYGRRRLRNQESDESNDSEEERSISDTETDDSDSNSGESSDNLHQEDSDAEDAIEHL